MGHVTIGPSYFSTSLTGLAKKRNGWTPSSILLRPPKALLLRSTDVEAMKSLTRLWLHREDWWKVSLFFTWKPRVLWMHLSPTHMWCVAEMVRKVRVSLEVVSSNPRLPTVRKAGVTDRSIHLIRTTGTGWAPSRRGSRPVPEVNSLALPSTRLLQLSIFSATSNPLIPPFGGSRKLSTVTVVSF